LVYFFLPRCHWLFRQNQSAFLIFFTGLYSRKIKPNWSSISSTNNPVSNICRGVRLLKHHILLKFCGPKTAILSGRLFGRPSGTHHRSAIFCNTQLSWESHFLCHTLQTVVNKKCLLIHAHAAAFGSLFFVGCEMKFGPN